MEYEVVSPCGWKDRSWAKGDRLSEADVPKEVLAVLVRNKAVRPVQPEPVRADQPAEPKPSKSKG